MTNTDNPFLNKNLFFLTSAFSRMLTRQADETFATVGLSSSHSMILWMVNENPEIQPSALADKMQLKPSTITRLVQKLERRGLIERKSQGRATSIKCTNEGSDLANSISQQWKKLLKQKREELGDRYVEVLSEMISNALESVQSD